MIPKSGNRFSEKIMLNQKARMRVLVTGAYGLMLAIIDDR
jgi:hypothetical protein